jgi:hypothetical protein
MFLGEKLTGIISGIFLKAQSPKPEKKNADLHEIRRIPKFPGLWTAVLNGETSAGLPIWPLKISGRTVACCPGGQRLS